MALTEQQRKANLRLALILASVALVFASASWPRSSPSAADSMSRAALRACADNRRMLASCWWWWR